MDRSARTIVVVLALAWAAVVAVRAERSRPAAAPAHAPSQLSETGLYEAGSIERLAAGVRPFSPQYPLWTDGAEKSRWVYLPAGTAIDTRNPDDWVFPVGTRFWKEFRFNGRRVETRMLWRASDEQWVFATYRWNEDLTAATLAPAEGVPAAAELAHGRFHVIPGTADCAACHGSRHPGPLGFNALQLSPDRDPGAIHGTPLEPGMVTLATLGREGQLSPARPEWVSSPPRVRARNAEERAVIGYLAANCGTCHNRGGDIAPNAPSLHYADAMKTGDTLLARLSQYHTFWQAPGQPDGATVMVDGASPDASAMLLRMRSRSPSSQMPPLGTALRDEDAIAAVTRWIAGR